MNRKIIAAAAAALAVYAMLILWRYGFGYRELSGSWEFGLFVLRVAALRVFVVLALLLSAYGYSGAAFGRRLPRFGTLLEELLFRCGLGLIVISYAMFALGLAHLLYPMAAYAVVMAGIALGYRGIPDLFTRLSSAGRTLRLDLPLVLILSVGAYFLIGGVYASLMPPTGFDVLMYHYGAPKLYIEAHRIFPTPDINGSSYPFGTEMLYMAAMLMEGPVSANLLNYSFAVLGGLAAASFCRRFLKGRAAALAFAVYVSVPAVYWLMPQSYVELCMAFYTMLAAYAVAAWTREGERGWLVAAALAAGFTMAIKYTGGIVVGLAGAWVLTHALFREKAGVRKAALYVAVFAVVCLAVSGAWYVKNLVYYSNPLYPLLDSALRGSVEGVYGMGGSGFWSGGLPEIAWRFLSSFWRTALDGASFGSGWANSIGPVFMMSVPGVLLYWKDTDKELWRILLFGLLYFLIMVPQSNTRYFVPALPMFAIAAAYAPGRLLVEEDIIPRVAGTAFVVLLSFGAVMASTPMEGIVNFPSASARAENQFYSAVTRSGYLASYGAWKWIDRKLPKDAVIYQLWDDASVYFRTRETIGTAQSWGEHGRQKLHIIAGLKGFGGFLPGPEITSNLKSMGAGYLLINANREGGTIPQDPEFTANVDLLYSKNGVFLYRLK